MVPILMIPTAYAAYKVYDKFFKSDEEKKAEEMAKLYVGVGVLSLGAVYLAYKISGVGDQASVTGETV